MTRAAVLALVVAAAAACADSSVASPPHPQPAATTGAVRGQLRLTGAVAPLAPLPVQNNQDFCGTTRGNPWLRVDASRGLADAVVYLADLPAEPASTTGETVDLDHVQCEITPRIRIVRPGATIVFRNSDPISHSTRLRVAGTRLLPFGHGLLPAGTPSPAPKLQLHDPAFYELECAFGHPLERGYLIVAAHRWYTVTAADGSFALDGVPPGKHTLKVWHPGWTFTIHQPDGLGRFAPRETTAPVTVTAGATATVAVSLEALAAP